MRIDAMTQGERGSASAGVPATEPTRFARSSPRLFRAKAPLRVSFAGGGTDVAPFPEREGGTVLSATINRYAYASLAPRDDRKISIESVDFGLSVDYGVDDELAFDGRLDLVKAAIKKFGRGGFDLFLHANAPPGSGLGSSSSVMVTLIGVLKDFHRQSAAHVSGRHMRAGAQHAPLLHGTYAGVGSDHRRPDGSFRGRRRPNGRWAAHAEAPRG
jgi:galactokinase